MAKYKERNLSSLSDPACKAIMRAGNYDEPEEPALDPARVTVSCAQLLCGWGGRGRPGQGGIGRDFTCERMEEGGEKRRYGEKSKYSLVGEFL